MKTRKSGTIRPGHEPRLAPGVRGYTVWSKGALYVPLVIAVREGHGDVGRYLDTMPTDRTVTFPNVMSPRLRGMLERRGYTHTSEASPFGPVPVMRRLAAPTRAEPLRDVTS
jgi:hypothetical protein